MSLQSVIERRQIVSGSPSVIICGRHTIFLGGGTTQSGGNKTAMLSGRAMSLQHLQRWEADSKGPNLIEGNCGKLPRLDLHSYRVKRKLDQEGMQSGNT